MNNKLEIYVEDFLNSINNILSKNTIDLYKNGLNKLFKFLNDKDFNSINIQEFLNQIDASNNTKKSFKSAISQFNKYLVMRDIVLKDYTIGIKVPKVGDKIYDVLTKEEEEKIYEHISKESRNPIRDTVICKVLLNTGCRISEVLNLRIKDIDMEKESIQILNSKGNKSRRVFLNKELKKQLVEYFEIIDTHDNNSLLFPISYVTWNAKLRSISNKLFPNKEFRSHTTRRTYASRLNENGVTTSDICSILGHESMSTTQKYIETFEENRKNIMQNN